MKSLSLAGILTLALTLAACGSTTTAVTPATPTSDPVVTVPNDPVTPPVPVTPDPPKPIVSTPLDLGAVPGGALPLTLPAPSFEAGTYTLVGAPEGASLHQNGTPDIFPGNKITAVLQLPDGLAPGKYSFSIVNKVNSKTYSTAVTLNVAGLKTFILPAGAKPTHILTDSQGNVFFGDSNGKKIGRIDHATATVTYFDMPAGASVSGIAVDSAGTVWTWDTGSSKILYLDPNSGRTGFVDGVQSTSSPTVAADGTVWWFDHTTAHSFSPTSGTISTYPIDTPSFYRPELISPKLDTDGNLWFIMNAINGALGRLNTKTGEVNFYRSDVLGDNPASITLSGSGVWFTYTSSKDNRGYAALFNKTTASIDKTVPLPLGYGYVATGSVIVESDGSLVTAGTGDGPGSLERIYPESGKTLQYWLTSRTTHAWSFARSPDGSYWISDIQNETITHVTP